MVTERNNNVISKVKPTGWVEGNVKYDGIVANELYNRCHLIAHSLGGADTRWNLVTGTRYLNEAMEEYELKVAKYINQTGNHVLYRVTPVYDGNNLVARGVQMEALSVEDGGAGVCFHVYVYNNQPGVTIDYATGDNWLDGESQQAEQPEKEEEPAQDASLYLLNTSSKKFHDESCTQGQNIKEENADTFRGSREDLINQGYEPAGCCKP
jgi:DNA-entry nuclease